MLTADAKFEFAGEQVLIVLDPRMNKSWLEETFDGVSARSLERFAGRAQRAAGLQGEVHILITSNRVIRTLNRRFRKKDKPTDVLSFRAAAEGAHGGDIAISAEIAVQQARAMGHSPEQELKVLMLHGILHLAGYDHERDQGEMARKEGRLRRALGLESSLIQRASDAKNPGRLGRAASAKRK